MHDPFVAREHEAQAAEDAAAYQRLSRPKQRVASLLASVGFTGRDRLVGSSAWIVGGLEAVLHFIFVWPYIRLSTFAASLADAIVRLASIIVDTLLGLAGKFLQAIATVLSNVVARLERRSRAARLGVILRAALRWAAALHQLTLRLAGKLVYLRYASIDFIESRWRQAKLLMRAFAGICYRGLEFYGAISLYRATKWLLNPRMFSGAPLLGNERLNGFFGLLMAGVGFVAFALLLLAVGVVAKIMHAELAVAFATDSGPFVLRLGKQIVFQPLITIGLTTAKFILLPIIAATRQALKSGDFTRAIAFSYNRRLRRRRRKQARLGYDGSVKRKILPLISVFAAHLVEKSAPTFYEGRLQRYRSERDARGSDGAEGRPLELS